MTLIINEIHLIDGFNNTMIVSAADRRLTCPTIRNRKYKYKTGKKIFEVKYLRATVSYWGNCVIRKDKGWELLSSWLPNFIDTQHEVSDIETFAINLRNKLNIQMPGDYLEKSASGFHISGYNKNNIPEFWHFSNCSYKDSKYTNLSGKFGEPYPDFLGKDAKEFGWDGKNLDSVKVKNKIQVYRNGDFRLHVVVWQKLDEIFNFIFGFPDFKRPDTVEKYKDYIKYKLNFIGSIYQKWGKEKIVGGPFDVVILGNN